VDAPPSALAPTLGVLAVLCLAMVVAMVRFSAAMMTPRRRRGGGGAGSGPRLWSRVEVLGAFYLLLWAAIVAAFLHLFALLGEPASGRNLALLLLVPAAWLGFNAVWIAFARAIARANARAAAAAGARSAPRAESHRAGAEEDPGGRPAAPPTAAEIRPGGGAEAPAAAAPAAPAQPPWKRVLTTAATVAVVLAALVAGEAIGPLKRFAAFMAAHQGPFLAPVIIMAAVGFVLFMGAAIHMVLTRGRPMSRREVEAMEAARLRGQMGISGFRGTAVGAEAHEEVSFREVKAAFRARAWKLSRRWRRFFVLAAGATLLFLGLFGVVFVLAPPGVKLLVAAVVVYAVARTADGIARS
jgi:hypothetical protein